MRKLFLVLLLLLLPVQSWAFTVYFKDGSELHNCASIIRFTPEVYGYDGDNALAKDGHVIHGDEARVVDKDGNVSNYYWNTIDIKPTKDSIREEWQTLKIKHLELEQEKQQAEIDDLKDRVAALETEMSDVETEMANIETEIGNLQGEVSDMKSPL